MTLRKLYTVLLIIVAAALASCSSDSIMNEHENAQNRADSTQAAEMADSALSAHAQTDEQQLKKLVDVWNSASNEKNTARLEKLYAEEVDLYGEPMSNTNAAASKEAYFNRTPDFHQALGDSINIQKSSVNTARADFVKTVTAGHKTKSYKAYLQFEKNGKNWRITEESDESTDKKLSTAIKPMPVKEITSCDKAAEAIFLSSAAVRKQLQQKYVRYKLEYRPGNPEAPNNRYWFWIYANAPDSRQVETYARYEVDPITGQLFEYKAVEDKAVPADYDKELKKYLKQYCGR
jgi:hypothetical protein